MFRIYCPEVPVLKNTPAILYFYDSFRNTPFKADVAVTSDDVIDDKFKKLSLHVSQMYEWFPFVYRTLDTVPESEDERLEWLHMLRVPRDGTLSDEDIISKKLNGFEWEYREAIPAAKYRDLLIKRYGERGKNILFAEAFEICEYRGTFSDELIPFWQNANRNESMYLKRRNF